MEQFLENIKEWLFTYSSSTGNASFWEIISAIGSLLVPILLTLWVIHNEKKRDKELNDIRNKQEELEGLREFVHTYISPFVDTSELKKNFKISITKVEWGVHILTIMVRESKYHQYKHEQISVLNDLLTEASNQEEYLEIINLIHLLPVLFYLSDQKFESIFNAILKGSQKKKT